MQKAEALRPQLQAVQENREAEANQFGAFIQVFEKRIGPDGEPHIACLSYPLPPGIGADQAKQMLFGIQKPDTSKPFNIGDYYRSESGELQFLAQEGARFDKGMLDRFLGVPEQELGIDQSKRREELLSEGVLMEFNQARNGVRHESAQASTGSEIFAFSYRQGADGVYGKDVKGKEGRRLSELAMEGDIEHAEMLGELEPTLMKMKEGVTITFDKSKTVSLCCALFFKNKLVSKYNEVADALKKTLSLYFGNNLATASEVDQKTCEDCGQTARYGHECLEITETA